MSDHPINEAREAMLAEGRGRALEPNEAEDLALLADLLADPSTWAEPRAGLEDEIVESIGVVPAQRPRVRRSRRITGAVAAVAAAAAISVAAVGALDTASADFGARLSASAHAPSARGSADITHNKAGFRVRLDAHGLPPLAAGEYYQAWLKDSHDVSVPIGTFSSSDGRITLWSGVSPKVFSKITVTKELTDNDQSSSGLVVLSGTVHSR
jgi:hypothetical protein